MRLQASIFFQATVEKPEAELIIISQELKNYPKYLITCKNQSATQLIVSSLQEMAFVLQYPWFGEQVNATKSATNYLKTAISTSLRDYDK